MSSLVWSDALSLSMPVMDETHREFVDLLAEVQASDDDTLLARWQALIDHTDDHFGREDRWMEATGFAPGSCHMTQHAVVLKVLREGAALGAQGNLAPIRQMAHELTIWFPQHAVSMDAGLALHMKSLGYDPVTGELARPEALPEQPITGCGGACGGHGHGESAAETPPAQAEATAHA
ncbi:hemerythrin domain-containing protein [Aquabacterium sp.]|uniref:hemerythrin domain-containing protein n=1 Tax=Aquabacterium sp. TaxID=1872578 RepID=UPI0025C6CA06|nr:hemerythrin domain-containing protein [Aquabacterium sp.]